MLRKENQRHKNRKRGGSCLENDRNRIDKKIHWLLDIYKKPYDPLHPVVCMDESPKQLIGETRKPIPI